MKNKLRESGAASVEPAQLAEMAIFYFQAHILLSTVLLKDFLAQPG
jgi:hypothetical protein